MHVNVFNSRFGGEHRWRYYSILWGVYRRQKIKRRLSDERNFKRSTFKFVIKSAFSKFILSQVLIAIFNKLNLYLN